MNIIKRLFCDHRIKFHSDIYGDSINHYNARSLYECEKCGKVLKSNQLGNEAKIFKLDRDLKAAKSVSQQLADHIESTRQKRILEGEPVLVRNRNDEGEPFEWYIRVSDGEGGVYVEGKTSGISTKWHEIIPFTKNPPK